ncbi:unnamed protein product [Bursaphelenchus xylophilus]|uniref:(pine wood nematode) hypothetical protein n=1 Tax=Bursaphelenchus xylophilus TaxID=6326 RepID=A0A811JWT7_BURXY|nr:unnamed protein product [Bursaphelenchus xylophilus]CAG9079878.1 unnamed protein product [Bursaphelenchus xylophilus]
MESGCSDNNPVQSTENTEVDEIRTAISPASLTPPQKEKKVDGSSIQKLASFLKRRQKPGSKSGSKESPNRGTSTSSSSKKLLKLLSKKKKKTALSLKPVRQKVSVQFPGELPKPQAAPKRAKLTKVGTVHFDHKKIEAQLRRQSRRKATCIRAWDQITKCVITICLASHVVGLMVVLMSHAILSRERFEFFGLKEPWKWQWKGNGRSTLMVRNRTYTQDVLNCTLPKHLKQGSSLNWSCVTRECKKMIRIPEKNHVYYFDSVDQFIRNKNY